MFQLLDENFDIIHTFPHHTSITWTSRFAESGSFRLQLPHDFRSSVDLMGKFIRHKGHYGIIQYISADEEQTEVHGYDLKAITIFRQVLPGTYTGAAETVIKQIVLDNTEGDRGFSRFSVAADQKRGETITYTVESPDTMENVLKKLCEDNGIGYTVTVQDKNMIFDVVIPNTVNHTYSERRQNVTGWEYTHDQLTEKNTEMLLVAPVTFIELAYAGNTTGNLYVSGKICVGNAIYDLGDKKQIISRLNYEHSPGYVQYIEARTDSTSSDGLKFTCNDIRDTSRTLIGRVDYFADDVPTFTMFPTFLSFDKAAAAATATGFSRKENCMETTETEIPTEKIKEDMSGKNASETITADVLSLTDYQTVWNLGDYVKIKIYLFGQAMTVSRQITEIDEVYEPNNIKITPVFGKQKDNIIRKLQKGRM